MVRSKRNATLYLTGKDGEFVRKNCGNGKGKGDQLGGNKALRSKNLLRTQKERFSFGGELRGRRAERICEVSDQERECLVLGKKVAKKKKKTNRLC